MFWIQKNQASLGKLNFLKSDQNFQRYRALKSKFCHFTEPHNSDNFKDIQMIQGSKSFISKGLSLVLMKFYSFPSF